MKTRKMLISGINDKGRRNKKCGVREERGPSIFGK